MAHRKACEVRKDLPWTDMRGTRGIIVVFAIEYGRSVDVDKLICNNEIDKTKIKHRFRGHRATVLLINTLVMH